MAISEIEKWVESQEYQVQLDSQGRIIDYLDSDITRDNKPEERIRQKTAHILHEEYGYPKESIGFEKTINIGQEKKRADIVIYQSKLANKENNQGKILLIFEIKAPNIKSRDGQLNSYISATSAQGGFWTNGSNIEYFRKDAESQEIIHWLGIPKIWSCMG